MTPPQVAIIGGGIAGTATARRLKEQEISSVIFEAGRRPGGRLCTQKQYGRQFDHGAQYLTPHSRRSAVLFSQWRKLGWIRPWPALALELPERKKIDTSSWHVACPSQASLIERLAEGLTIECRTTIVAIEGERGRRYLLDSEGEKHGPFEAVVCTAPAEASLQLLQPFPELASLASQVRTRPCLAAMVLFEEEVMVDFEAAYLSEGPLAWVCKDASKPERPKQETWILHATEEWSVKELDTSTEKVASMLLSAFAALCFVELPSVSYCRAHRWRHALSKGSLELPFCYDDDLRIGVAGEWCSGPNVDSSYWSGVDLANALARTL